MKELPRIIVNDEEEIKTNEKPTIEFEIKSDLVGGNESTEKLINPENERKVKRITDLVLEKKEIEKAPHPPALPIPKMPEKAPHPPALPIPQKLTIKMRLNLLRRQTQKNTKEITKKIYKIDFIFVIAIAIMIIGILITSIGLYEMISIKIKYQKYTKNFTDANYKEIYDFCQNRNFKECPKYVKYIEGLELINQKQYKKAEENFEQLTNFYNSNYYIKYIEALENIKNYNIEEAKINFNKTNNILNTKYYIEYIKLTEQINNGNEQNIDEAYDIELYIDINYISKYIDGIKLFNDKDYKRVIETLEESAKFINQAKIILDESKYIYAKNLQLEGYIGSAHKLLNELGEYKDVKSILEHPIYAIINNWYYEEISGFSMNLAFYETSDTCFHNIKNGKKIGLTYDNDTSTYDYRIKNNIIYFKNTKGEYKPIYIIKSFGKTEMKIQIENKIIELHIQNYEI